ncbi:MAG: anaerobic ribonucleoside-triphosphate reductase activating protein [Oscillospiraceae bacterium]|nr:anaerobic ribonucleoside-triphosphate reductase activating protein [Oscillospiraceae bacterium]
MRIAGTIQDSIVDGPGMRFTVFTQGCPHRCEGCQNPQTHDFDGGSEKSTDEIIAQMLENPLTDGVTLSGGEPFAQPEGCSAIAKAARDNGLNVWAYSGYTFEELLALGKEKPEIMELLELVDVLVDGRFELDKRSLDCKWRGSTNQRLINVKSSLEQGKAVEL